MVKLCRGMLADTSPGAVKRREGTAITEAWLTATEALAARVKKTGEAAAAVVTQGDVKQAEVDRYDGMNLYLLKIFIDAFETANAVDPEIPRLVPISLRNWFNRGQRPTAADDDDGDGEEAAVDAEPAAEGDTKVAAGAEAAKAPDAATAKPTGPAAGKAKTTVKG